MKIINALSTITIVTILFAGCNSSLKSKAEKTEIFDSPPQMEQTTRETPMTFDTEIIMTSALEGNFTTIKEALENGFDANTIDSNKRTALMLAAYNGHTDIVKFLIEKGTDVNLTDTVHRTALMYASSGPFLATVIALLESGAEPNIADHEENWTAIMMAAAEGQLEVIKALVAYGADIEITDVDGESSLDFANSKGHTAVAEYLKTQMK